MLWSKKTIELFFGTKYTNLSRKFYHIFTQYSSSRLEQIRLFRSKCLKKDNKAPSDEASNIFSFKFPEFAPRACVVYGGNAHGAVTGMAVATIYLAMLRAPGPALDQGLQPRE